MATKLLAPAFNQAGQIVSVISPVPLLGPALQLVASLIELCENVSKNRNAAKELAYRCQKLVDTIKEDTITRDPISVHAMVDDLLQLLKDVEHQMIAWGKINWFRGFVRQAKVADTIKKYHEEIDRFCQRFLVKSLRDNFEWRSKFEEQVKNDHQEVINYIADGTKAQEVANQVQTVLMEGVRDDVKGLAVIIQQSMLQSLPNSEERKGLESNFSALLCTSDELPPACELTDGLVKRTSPRPIGGGDTFEIYRGICYGRIEVALKAWRHVKIDHKTKERFDRQYKAWKVVYEKDKGKYILPLLGVVYHSRPEPTIMLCSKWMEKGTAIKYVKNNPDIDRRDLIRKIGEGIQFLHTFDPPYMHGEIQGSNILINDFGEPVLSDFGLLRVVDEFSTIHETSLSATKALVRWYPLELICDDQPNTTKVKTSLKADITMWALTVLELMTEEVPFSQIRTLLLVVIQRRNGLKPERPGPKATERGLDDKLWALMQRCWEDDPDARPTIQEVLEEI